MAITSEEVNFLVYRYLQESGFMHSAFTFAYESQLAKSDVITAEIPPGALISFIQKGLQYVGIEAHLNEDGTERPRDTSYSLLDPHACRIAQSSSYIENDHDTLDNLMKNGNSKGINKRKRKTVAENATETNIDTNLKEVNGGDDHVNSMILLSGHEKEVYGCVWNPKKDILLTGSSDSTARIWDLSIDIVIKKQPQLTPIILNHGSGPHNDVTTLEWSSDGSQLATGSYNGKSTIWSISGEKKHEFHDHNGPVFAVRWSPTSKYLLSISFDKTVSIWDTIKESKAQQIQLHDDPILDASWKDDLTFATCSSDKKICVVRVGDTQAQMILRGHTDAINSVRWDPSRRLLASCSDDYSVKVWNPTSSQSEVNSNGLHQETLKSEKIEQAHSNAGCAEKKYCNDKPVESENSVSSLLVHDFQEHKKEVYTVRWSSTGPGTDLPNASFSLASASFDATVKIWDVEVGSCKQTFTHVNSVYGIAYSPNGDYIASGTIGGCVNIWSLKDGRLVKRNKFQGDIYDLNWNTQGTLLCACVSNGDTAVIHFRT